MKKIIGIIVVILMIPVIISVIGDIDRTPVYPTTEFNIEKLTRISSLDIRNNDIELLKLPNGVGDRWLSVGTIERNVGKVVLDSSDIILFEKLTTVDRILIKKPDDYIGKGKIWFNELKNDLVFELPYTEKYYTYANRDNVEHINTFTGGLGYNEISIVVEKGLYNSRNDVEEAISGTVVYYQLATPIIENAPTFPEFIDFYDGGSVIVDDGIIDYTIVGNQARINYIEGNITTVEGGQFKISKPTKIISKSNDLYDYDLSTLPNYFEYGSLPQGTYENILEFIDNNKNKQIKLFFNDNIQESRYNAYLENDTIIINNDSEVIRIYNNDTYTSTRNLDTDITYKLEGYNILGYIDGKFDNTVLAFFWVIPVLLVGGLIYLLLKRKE